jgi:DNA invertase Pin-like site-specific DNA recombinase
MSTQIRRAAQYIRMSTDRQDLSPLVQKDGIAAFACANGLEIVSSYEDAGKSGVGVSNRPSLRKLLRDVEDKAVFSVILVYDVSRWGRFQDVDAAAYYEYHCRLHGVQVIYVRESFANDQTPTTVLLKSMRRVMAAEYSRDIAFKAHAGQQRVISMGFHMGPLPALGYRRCSVSADRSRRLMLDHGQRKAALTDRIEWVLGPNAEVDLVQRICTGYASGLQLDEIANLVNAEGWRTDKGRVLSTQGLRILLANEALIGNFVWGVKSKGGKVIQCSPTRMDRSVPRIVDDGTWAVIQKRLKGAALAQPALGASAASPRNGGPDTPRPRQLRLALAPTASDQSYRRTLGAPQQLRDHTREFGRALCVALRAQGLPTSFDTRTNVLTFWNARVRVRLMWPADATTWVLERSRGVSECGQILVARMSALYCPLDFFLLSPRAAETGLSRPLNKEVPRRLRPYLCSRADELIERLSAVCAQPGRLQGDPATQGWPARANAKRRAVAAKTS